MPRATSPVPHLSVSAFWKALKSCLLFETALLSHFDLCRKSSDESRRVARAENRWSEVKYDTRGNESDRRSEGLLCQPTFWWRLYIVSKFFTTGRRLFLRGFCPHNWQAHSDWLVHERAMVYLCSLPESLRWIAVTPWPSRQYRTSCHYQGLSWGSAPIVTWNIAD